MQKKETKGKTVNITVGDLKPKTFTKRSVKKILWNFKKS